MSIPRSKERVCVKTHDVDGTLLSERYATQNVYRPEGKTPYIMWAGGKRPLVSDAPPVAEYNVLARPVDCSWGAVERMLAEEKS